MLISSPPRQLQPLSRGDPMCAQSLAAQMQLWPSLVPQLILLGTARSRYCYTADGKAFSWGFGSYGKLGHGDETGSALPKYVRLAYLVVSIPLPPPLPKPTARESDDSERERAARATTARESSESDDSVRNNSMRNNSMRRVYLSEVERRQ